jgi:DNA helicase-2/ATP-dependent DNA helicase PcrA
MPPATQTALSIVSAASAELDDLNPNDQDAIMGAAARHGDRLGVDESEMLALVERYRTRLGLSYDPSSYQAKIFSWVDEGRGHGVVQAVAGSGKSTTIISAARLISGSGLFLAFNKDIATELAGRLAGTRMRAATIHSHGFAAVRAACGNVRLNDMKYRDMVDAAGKAVETTGSIRGYGDLSAAELASIKEDGFPGRTCEKLINLARLALLDMDRDGFGDALLDLADRHGLADFDGVLDDLVIMIVQRAMQIGADRCAEIDYTDMVWLPVVNQWPATQYSWLFVDEAQDMSKAALALVRKSIRAGGRILAVGDPAQSIYAFAGADSDSFSRIITELNAVVMPLSVCYRCPTSVVEVARQWCPQIEARAGAPIGIVRKATTEAYVAEAKEGDMVLCRRTAPLIGLCFELISEGMPAVVRGRDIAAGLAKIVDKVDKRARCWTAFDSHLTAWESKQVASILQRTKDVDRAAQKIEVVRDQAEVLRIIAAKSEAKSAADLKAAINSLFSDQRGSVVLSTIHRAKGLEADRVAILESEKLPYAARHEEQQRQENNAAYVCWTRAKVEAIELISKVNVV